MKTAVYYNVFTLYYYFRHFRLFVDSAYRSPAMETEAVRDVRKRVEIGDTTSLFLSETAKPSLAVALSLYFKRSKDDRAKV